MTYTEDSKPGDSLCTYAPTSDSVSSPLLPSFCAYTVVS